MTSSQPHKQTYRSTPSTITPLNSERIASLLAREWETYKNTTHSSLNEFDNAQRVIPLGVTSSFQHWDPYPVSIVSARGAWMTDVDGRELLDLSMGFGAMLAGHLNPTVVEEIKSTLEVGTLFVTPSPTARDAAQRICRRFSIDQVRFTNSGTEATMYAVRTARAVSGRLDIVKVEGGYHGSYDPLMVSAKPSLDAAGDANNPNAVHPDGTVSGNVHVVPYNNLESLERVFKAHADSIACFIVEPVLENIGIVLPDEGYLEGVRALCDQYGIILIFDEVKTGLTAGVQGAAQRLSVTPDLICLAKSIGGGVPLAAFGGKKQYMDAVTDGRMAHFGTFNGNPLAMAGVRAIDKICTDETLGRAEELNMNALKEITGLIEEYELPAHTVGFGIKGCVTWSSSPVRNYRDYKATDFHVAELSWLWSLNRGIITPPGLDEQWLVSLAHSEREMNLLVEDFRELAQALRA
ncbi:MAG: hypothetical protein RL441_215 [Actinomycetota bacterium]